MYCHKLTGKDFDEMFELGIFYDKYCKKERKCTVTHINYCNNGALLIVYKENDKYKYEIDLSDYDFYSLFFGINRDKYHKYMFNKFGEGYINSLLRRNKINPDTIKEIYTTGSKTDKEIAKQVKDIYIG